MFTADEAAARTALVDRAISAHTRQTGAPPAWAWFVPGRIEIFGKHTDYAGGRSLVAAVPRGFAVVASRRADAIVSVLDARWSDTVDVDPGDQERRFKGWTNYAAVVTRRLALNFPGARLGTSITIASDLPRAAGLSSSSALVVGLATAIAQSAALGDRPEWQNAIRSELDLAGYLGAAENGLAFGSLVNASGVGTHGGSEDHTAILASRAGEVAAFSYMPVQPVGSASMPADWRFAVMTSGVHADKAGSAKGRYNRASLATRALSEIWAEGAGHVSTLAEALRSAPDAEHRLRAHIPAAGRGEFSAEDLSRRLRHFIDEDARVPLALEAFRRADAAQLGTLSDDSQYDADVLLGNQVEETIRLARAARENGAFAASSFGAGFGGSVWALVDAAEADDFCGRWHRAYASASAPGPIESFVTRPAPRVTALDLSEL